MIQKQIEATEREYEEACSRMVNDQPGGVCSPNYEVNWNNFYNTCGRELNRKIDALKWELRKAQYLEMEVGDGATIRLYSDRHACTVIKRTAKTLTVQQDKATLDPNFKPEWVEGGFAGHCTNQDQQTYTYERDKKGSITVFHWSEKNGRWQAGSDGTITLGIGRHEFYDYNF